MQADCFSNLIAGRKYGIQRCHGFLENHRNAIPPDGAHLFVTVCKQIPFLENDPAVYNPARRLRYQPQDRQGRNRFTTTGLANQSQRLFFIDRKADAIYCFDDTIIGVEVRM